MIGTSAPHSMAMVWTERPGQLSRLPWIPIDYVSVLENERKCSACSFQKLIHFPGSKERGHMLLGGLDSGKMLLEAQEELGFHRPA